MTGAERSQVMLASCSEPLKMKSQRMNTVYFITHPDVVIDPATPVAQWPLSQRGRMRMLNRTLTSYSIKPMKDSDIHRESGHVMCRFVLTLAG